MWGIAKPDIKETLADVDVFKDMGIISEADTRKLKKLVGCYDAGNGAVTEEQHSWVSSEGAKSIHKNYPETYSGKPLDFIRKALCDDVLKCPYCAVGQVNTLDHYMPKSKYKALALCRLNLVPMCWACNKQKGHDKPYDEFVHPYYTGLTPGTVFLRADIQVVNNDLAVTFSFDADGLNNAHLHSQLTSHWRNLKLDERLQKSVIDFIHSEVLSESDDKEVLQVSLEALLSKAQKGYGMNDWRTSVLKALLDKLESEDGEPIIEALKYKKQMMKDINY